MEPPGGIEPPFFGLGSQGRSIGGGKLVQVTGFEPAIS